MGDAHCATSRDGAGTSATIASKGHDTRLIQAGRARTPYIRWRQLVQDKGAGESQNQARHEFESLSKTRLRCRPECCRAHTNTNFASAPATDTPAHRKYRAMQGTRDSSEGAGQKHKVLREDKERSMRSAWNGRRTAKSGSRREIICAKGATTEPGSAAS